jgi:hypothetical protein
MSRNTDQKLDAAARALNKVAGPVGDAIANTVLAPLRSNTPCTCKDPQHKH